MTNNGKHARSEDYPEGFIEACRRIYTQIGPLAYAREVLGCWIFETPEVLYISGPMAVKIDTGEPIHFHIPALMTDKNYRKEMAARLGVSVEELMDAMVGDEDDEGIRETPPKIEVPERFKQRLPQWDAQEDE